MQYAIHQVEAKNFDSKIKLINKRNEGKQYTLSVMVSSDGTGNLVAIGTGFTDSVYLGAVNVKADTSTERRGR